MADRRHVVECNKRGHWQGVCQSKQAKGNVNELEVEYPFIEEVSKSSAEYWKAEIEVNGQPITFKLDNGAAVSVISDQEPLINSYELVKPKEVLRGPGGSRLSVLGICIDTCLKAQGKEMKETLYVIKNQLHSLLSRNACVKLGLVVRADTNEEEFTPTPDYRAEFHKLFKGLGKMKT
ncbi:predicted protein [Nematostella vectensis]|uniref:Retropepsins domain-containing protein n=1 Tax=Nematostella vectensis TaxID=45351 RepID=A7RR88_NEMVE|nr:predicted protein [Nematostella vectensis]|eukprot:XP_001638189.1 predicted protein [Nematostella vectensis]